jgi:hypothetical protein
MQRVLKLTPTHFAAVVAAFVAAFVAAAVAAGVAAAVAAAAAAAAASSFLFSEPLVILQMKRTKRQRVTSQSFECDLIYSIYTYRTNRVALIILVRPIKLLHHRRRQKWY